MVGDGVVQVQLHSDALAFLIASVTPAMLLVEIAEECLPGLLSRRLPGQLHHGLRYHTVCQCLVVPAILYPQSRLAVPLGHAWRVNPRHAPRMDAPTLAHRLVGACEEFRLLGIELSEEHPVAVHRLGEQLDGSRGPEVGILPRPELPDKPSFLVHLDGLHRGIGGVHRGFVPLVIPVVDDVSPVLQTDGLLRLGHAVLRRVQLPHRPPLAVDLLYQALAARNEQVARLGHLLHRPR